MSALETTRAAWLASRRMGLGGSEVAAILGLHPFMGAIDVWLSKVEGYDRPSSPLMEQGQFLEDGVARWYASRHGVELRECGHLVHPSRARLMCTPDRLVNHADGNTRLLSIKVPGPWYDSEEWGERHHWRVPTYAYLQIQHELMVAGPMGLGLVRDDYAHLAAPLGGDLQVLEVRGDVVVMDRLATECEAWWAKHVDGNEPPPLDGSAGAKDWLRRRFPQSPNPIRDATPAEDVLAMEFRAAERAWTAADRAYETTRQRLEEAIGASEGLRGAFGRITFRANKKGSRTLLTNWMTGEKP